MKFSSYCTDPKAEVDGVWIDIIDGVRVKVARAGNARFIDYLRRISKPFIQQIRKETLPIEKAEDLQREAYAHCILLGWEGFEDDDGNAIPYSPEKANELLSKSSDFYREIRALADERANFTAAVRGDSEKN